MENNLFKLKPNIWYYTYTNGAYYYFSTIAPELEDKKWHYPKNKNMIIINAWYSPDVKKEEQIKITPFYK